MVGSFSVDFVQKSRKRCRFTRTGWTSNKHQPAWVVRKTRNNRWHSQFGYRFDFVWDKTQSSGQVTTFMECVHTETTQRSEGKAKVELLVFHQNLLLILVKN